MLRTISKAIAEIRASDPDTGVTVYLIREAIKQNKVKHVKTGNKYLVNLRSLKEYLGMEVA